jgi:hypothetical protein
MMADGIDYPSDTQPALISHQPNNGSSGSNRPVKHRIRTVCDHHPPYGPSAECLGTEIPMLGRLIPKLCSIS